MNGPSEEELEEFRDKIQRRGIQMPVPQVADGPQKLTLEGMYLMAQRVLQEWHTRALEQYDWLPEQLVELAGPEGARTGDKRTQHEIRLRDFSLFEENFVGRIRTDLFEFHMHQLLEVCLSQLELEQDHLAWGLVAVKVERVVSSTQMVKRTEAADSNASVDAFKNPKKSAPIEQGNRTVWEEIPTYSLSFTLVWADLLGGDPKDPNATQENLIPGASPMAAYAETRMVRDMPKGLRIQWEKAERLLREFYGLPQREREDLSRMRARHSKVRGPGQAPVPRARASGESERSLPEAEAPEPLPAGVAFPVAPKASGVEQTVRTLFAQGIPPASIAKRLRKTVDEVNAILSATEAAP